MSRRTAKNSDDNLRIGKWLDSENNLRDFEGFCEFIIDLFKTRDKLSKQKLFKLLGGEQQFREHVAAAALRFKQRDKSRISELRLISYVYFLLAHWLRNKQK